MVIYRIRLFDVLMDQWGPWRTLPEILLPVLTEWLHQEHVELRAYRTYR